jgi:5'-3' exonuclease
MKSDISVNQNWMKDGFLFMDIDVLSNCLSRELSFNHNDGICRIHDYIFLCFFLGNDFLPRFPALNIRTNGFQILLETYRQHMKKPNQVFILNGEIQWKLVHQFISELAKQERGHILRELESRKKFDYKKLIMNETSDFENILNDVPILYRGAEKYISPKYGFWEERYYRALLHGDRDTISKTICQNYMEGLEWVYKYYTIGCVDWSWKYKYHYPPLLTDLANVHSQKDVFGKQKEDKRNHDIMRSLRYVLANQHLHLLPPSEVATIDHDIAEKEKEKGSEWLWAFKRYLWEGVSM